MSSDDRNYINYDYEPSGWGGAFVIVAVVFVIGIIFFGRCLS